MLNFTRSPDHQIFAKGGVLWIWVLSLHHKDSQWESGNLRTWDFENFEPRVDSFLSSYLSILKIKSTPDTRQHFSSLSLKQGLHQRFDLHPIDSHLPCPLYCPKTLFSLPLLAVSQIIHAIPSLYLFKWNHPKPQIIGLEIQTIETQSRNQRWWSKEGQLRGSR